MLGILLFILKIIGIIILSILGLVLFLLLIILFVPIRYEADVSVMDKKPAGTARVSWLCRLFQIQVSFGKEAKGLQIRIAGKLLGTGKKSKSAKDVSTDTAKKQDTEITLLPDETTETTENSDMGIQSEKDKTLLDKTINDEILKKEEPTILPNMPDEITKEPQKKVLEQPIKEIEDAELNEGDLENLDAKESNEKETFEEKLTKICDTVEKKIEGIRVKLNGLNQKRLWILSLLEELQTEPMKGSLTQIKNQLVKILLHILPRKGKVDLKIGFNNPATTGQMLGILAILYPNFKGDLSVVPYFERSILEGSVFFKGHIRLIVLAAAVVKILLDKNVWRFIKKVRTKHS